MDLEKIEGLVKIIDNSSLMEFTYKEDNIEISMSKKDNPPVVSSGVMSVPMAESQQTHSQDIVEEHELEEQLFITSPIVGTFYSAPAPDAPTFVKVGDHVKNGQTVCILEAMKLMNEIQSDFDCEIEAVLVSNEQKVEYGQPLFRIKKL